MNESEYYAGELKMDSKLASHIWLMLQAFWSSEAGTKILAYLQAWLTQAIKLRFRKGIVVDLLDEWLPRAYRLTHAGAIGANPDQRIYEDAHHLADFRTALIGLTSS
jgi:putative ATP-binding cassette transporter